MGYSYFAGREDVLEPEVIAKVVPDAWAAFHAAVAAIATLTNRSADDLLAAIGREEDRGDCQYDDEATNDTIEATAIPALEALKSAFTAATSGLTLGLGHVDGDTLRGSDLCDEVIWYIGNHEQPTPAYEAFKAIHGAAATLTWITGG